MSIRFLRYIYIYIDVCILFRLDLFVVLTRGGFRMQLFPIVISHNYPTYGDSCWLAYLTTTSLYFRVFNSWNPSFNPMRGKVVHYWSYARFLDRLESMRDVHRTLWHHGSNGSWQGDFHQLLDPWMEWPDGNLASESSQKKTEVLKYSKPTCVKRSF